MLAASFPPWLLPQKNRELDEEGLREASNYLIENGVHGLFVCGIQGEEYALNNEERMRVIEATVDEVNGRVPAYAGTGGVTTRDAIELTKHALNTGADAVSIVTPYFVRPSQDELFQHYERIAESVEIPILLHNNPGRTGVNLDATTASRLAEIDNIVGIKDSSGDLTLTAEYVLLCPEEFTVLAGRDSLILATLLYGGRRAIAATANIVPRLVVGMYQSFVDGDIEKARELQSRLLPLRLAFELGTFPVVVKEAMRLINIPAGPAKSPVRSLSEKKRRELRKIMKDIGAL